ncbi:phospholipase D family protein [Paenibacillus silvae]|uniref:phospholipase D family protein n=1 Tax=Paenibacillus silvae TaxID=1325358 RepID=UPI0011A39B85|nr:MULTISPECIES: phospholipase D family protein [Paenibacillus]MCK6075754.1 phospholipase D family protein [Paenibacillus silvae]MCK6150142.1 phospholipase D family protein [Paenibacillus silvae]MCK6268440.1 phospholipase D family protein [Paenibacillus silvae]
MVSSRRSISEQHSSQRKFPYIRTAIVLLILWLIAVMIYQTYKPLPPGISYESSEYRVQNVQFLNDLTYPSSDGQMQHEQQIFQRMLQVVKDAEQFVVVDMFLYNNYQHKGQHFPPVSQQFTDTLIAKKTNNPDMNIWFITDEVNTNYNAAPNPLLEQMKQAGIHVVITNLDPLRDSTPVYSAVWRTFFQWFGQSGKGWIPNLMATDGPDVTLRSYLKLLNVKANHRKVVASEKTAIVSSGNIHDASAYHSNIGFEVTGPVIGDIIQAEQAVVDMSGGGQLPVYDASAQTSSSSFSSDSSPFSEAAKESESEGPIRLRYLTEGKVNDALLYEINQTGKGDTLWMGMFYIASPKVLEALLDASKRGTDIRLVLDPNENAFGQEKIGIPNRPVAAELHDKSSGSIQVRWYNTTKEQYHTKMIYIAKATGDHIVIGGSTNFTPRNLNDYNLENDMWIAAPADAAFTIDVADYFKRIWVNEDATFTLNLEEFQENTTFLKGILYKLQLILGFTTF